MAELRFRQAEVKYQNGLTDDALGDFRRFVRTYAAADLLPDAYFYLGTIYAERGQQREAESALDRVVTSYPQSARSPDAARHLGRLYLDQERHQEALDVYRRLEQARPDDASVVAQARYGQGQALLGLGRAREAEVLLREAVDAAPDAPESIPALLGLARVYDQQGRTGDAIQLYRRVVDRNREEAGAEALYLLGDLLVRLDDPRGAIEELSRMPVLYAGFPDRLAQGYLLQARAFRNLGQTGEASRLYDRVLNEFGGTRFADEAGREKASL